MVSDNVEHRVFRAQFTPVLSDTFRLMIESSANPKYPNAAQVSEIQLICCLAVKPEQQFLLYGVKVSV